MWHQDYVIDCGSPVNQAHPIHRGCVAWWLPIPGNCGGMILHDLMANRDLKIGHHAKLVSSGGTYSKIVQGNNWPCALTFDGSTQSCSLTADASIASLNKFSIFSWNFPIILGSAGVSKGLYGRNTTSGFCYTGTKIDFISTSNHTGATIVSTNAWHLTGYTYDGTTLKGYLDGKQDYSSAVSVTLPANGAAIGANGSAQFFNGIIQDIKIWNRVLSTDEILYLKLQGSSGYPQLIDRIDMSAKYFSVPSGLFFRRTRSSFSTRVGSRQSLGL